MGHGLRSWRHGGSRSVRGLDRPPLSAGRDVAASGGASPVRASGFNQRASTLQTNPSRTKPDQTKPSKIAWFYSSGSGLFNGLRRIQIRIFQSLSQVVCARCLNRLSPRSFCSFGAEHARAPSASGKCITQISAFAKKKHNFLSAAICDPSSGRCRSPAGTRFRRKVAGTPDIGREHRLLRGVRGVGGPRGMVDPFPRRTEPPLGLPRTPKGLTGERGGRVVLPIADFARWLKVWRKAALESCAVYMMSFRATSN